MDLFFIRHGKPESVKSNLSSDERALSEEGRIELFNAVNGWKKIISPIDQIISSPLRRAKETALIIKDIMKIDRDIVFESGLSTGMHINDLLELINSFGVYSVAIVGHEPHISRYTSYLISDGSAEIGFRQGMLVKIDFTGKAKRASGELIYQVPSEVFK